MLSLLPPSLVDPLDDASRQPPPFVEAVFDVVVADDDEPLRQALRFSLELDGFRVRTHADVASLLADPALPNAGCLVLDQRLGSADGLDALAELRRRGIAVPAVLITSHPSAVVRRRAAAAGVGIVEKPLLGDALVGAIRGAVSQE